MTAGRPAGRGLARWQSSGRTVLVAYFAVAAALFAATTLCAIVNFGWRQPMFDQWHEYETFLGLPFPQNVLQVMNGHRPILPNLVRVAEIHALAANQLLQLTVGAACAFLSAALLALVAWRERAMNGILRAAGVLLAVTGVLWLANARRLLHGSEALNGYLPTLGAIVAALCMYRSAQRNSMAWLAAACAACILATFSFGLGVASFCGILALGIVLRMPWRRLAVPVLALAMSLLVYVFVLPGNAGVRQQVEWQPLGAATLLAQWLASPWKTGWFDLVGQPRSGGWAAFAEPALMASAKLLAVDTGLGPDRLCLVLGLAGIAAFAGFAIAALRRGLQTGPLEAIAIATGTYALASGAITVLGRMEYLRQYPEQLYADRYLAWPSLFWCALALLLLRRFAAGGNAFTRAAGLLVLVALPPMLLVMQNRDAIWGALVHRVGQQAAAALRSGVFDDSHFPGEAFGPAVHRREIELLRNERLAMFADPGWERLGKRWTGRLETNARVGAQAHWLAPVLDDTSNRPAAHLEGWITHGIASVGPGDQLVILADDGVIAGLAEFSFIRPGSRSLLLTMPRKRGFDGYLRDPDEKKKYTLALVDFGSDRGIALATLPPRVEATATGGAGADDAGPRGAFAAAGDGIRR